MSVTKQQLRAQAKSLGLKTNAKMTVAELKALIDESAADGGWLTDGEQDAEGAGEEDAAEEAPVRASTKARGPILPDVPLAHAPKPTPNDGRRYAGFYVTLCRVSLGGERQYAPNTRIRLDEADARALLLQDAVAPTT